MAKRKRKSADEAGKKSKVQPPQRDFASFFESLPSPRELITEEQKEDLSPKEKRWFEFQDADYEEQIALCHQTIDEPALMDEENAFEMFNTIFYSTVERGERSRFEALANKLREHLPDIFAAEAHFILDGQITNALAEGRQKDVLPLALELAQTGGEHLDMFVHTLDMLEYHDQLAVLLKVTPVAWPDVKDGGYFEWGVREFAARAGDYIVFGFLELNPALQADDPDLQEKLSFYYDDLDQEAFASFIEYMTGRAGRQWTMRDFGFEHQLPTKKKGKKTTKSTELSDEAEQNLYDLTFDFLYYLRHEENVPYTKGRLARTSLLQYLVDRFAGELAPREGLLQATMREGFAAEPRKSKQQTPDHWLCPDRNTLDHYLATLVDFMSGRYHQAVATFELVPAWLRFLESRRLIDADQRARTLRELRGLDTEMLKVFKTHADPALARAIEQWREE